MSKNTNKSGSKTPAKATPVKASAPAKKSYGTLIALIVVLVAAVAIIAVMNNLLNLWGVPPFLREAFKGLIVVAAVLLQKKENNA